MGKTKIEWATHTWNPVVGCSKVSEGCRNCYAERIHTARHKGWKEGWKSAPRQYHLPFDKVQFHWFRLDEPRTWRKARRVFCCSMSDLFHEVLPDSWILSVLNTMEDVNANRIHSGKEPHTFIVLTKRAERMRLILNEWFEGFTRERVSPDGARHIWFGVSAEDQKAAEERIPHLLGVHAPVPIIRFVSAEPLLGRIDLARLANRAGIGEGQAWLSAVHGWTYDTYEDSTSVHKLNWVIVGGETGVNAREMRLGWVLDLYDQAVSNGIPFFFKQWGEYDEEGQRVGRRKAGRLLLGKEWNEFPVVGGE